MVKKLSAISVAKGLELHPRFSAKATIKDIVDTPSFLYESDVAKKTRHGAIKREVNLLVWWGHLTPDQKRKVLFLAQRRTRTALAKRLLKETNMTSGQIAEKLHSINIPASSQGVLNIAKEVTPGRDPRPVRLDLLKKRIAAEIQRNSRITWDEIGRRVGLTGERVSDIAKELGLEKKYGGGTPDREKFGRFSWLREKAITFNKKDKSPKSVEEMEQNYNFFKDEKGFTPKTYDPFLRLPLNTLKVRVANLERYGIDWANERFWSLLGNSPDYIDSQMRVLDAVGASSELHGLLFSPRLEDTRKQFVGRYPESEKAVITKDVLTLFNFVAKTLTKKIIGVKDRKYVFVAENIILETFTNCKHPEQDPTSFLVILFRNVMHGLKEEAAQRNRKDKRYTDAVGY